MTKKTKITAVLVKYGEQTVEGDVFVKGCFDKSPNIIKWGVNKQKSKAGDNAEIVKLQTKVRKLKEVLADTRTHFEFIPYSLRPDDGKALDKRIQRALHL